MSQLLLRLILRRFRVEEEISVGVAVIFNFCRDRIAVAEGEVAVGAGSEALDTTLTIIVDLLVERVMPHDRCSCHGTDGPKQETQQPLKEVDSHVAGYMLLIVTSEQRRIRHEEKDKK